MYDLYTGTGTIAQFVAKKAKKVIGIEAVTDAIKDAKINAQFNNIDNVEFIDGDMKDVFNTEFINLMKPLGLVDVSRTGVVAISSGIKAF